MSLSSSIESTRTARRFLLMHVLVVGLSSAPSFFFLEWNEAQAFFLGNMLLLLSLLSLYLAVYWGMVRKKTGLAVGVIVFKWPLLIYIVLQSVKTGNVPFVYLACGFSTWLLTALLWAVCEKMELDKSGRTF